MNGTWSITTELFGAHQYTEQLIPNLLRWGNGVNQIGNKAGGSKLTKAKSSRK
jgi:hypothetical protein